MEVYSPLLRQSIAIPAPVAADGATVTGVVFVFTEYTPLEVANTAVRV